MLEIGGEFAYRGGDTGEGDHLDDTLRSRERKLDR